VSRQKNINEKGTLVPNGKNTCGWQTNSVRLETLAGNGPFEGQSKPPAERVVVIYFPSYQPFRISTNVILFI
jgi:hypothetical protein